MVIKKYFKILINSKECFLMLQKKSFEDEISDYMKMVLIAGIITGTFNFIYSLLNSIYLNKFYNVEVSYSRLINYSLSQFAGTIFFYIFLGTFFIFILSIILKLFFRNMKYTDLLKIIFPSLSPLLLFSWIPLSLVGLILWSTGLFVQGIRIYKKEEKPKKIKGTINERE